ncbi:MAG TPA: hypothetical protein VJN01_12295, partial [Xanthomonadales bacterium]|nr:hypothetical protein [Xanthomonadales bacterium]
GMLGGFLTTVAWVLWFKSQYYELLEIVPGFVVGLTLTVLVSHMTAKPLSVASKARSYSRNQSPLLCLAEFTQPGHGPPRKD